MLNGKFWGDVREIRNLVEEVIKKSGIVINKEGLEKIISDIIVLTSNEGGSLRNITELYFKLLKLIPEFNLNGVSILKPARALSSYLIFLDRSNLKDVIRQNNYKDVLNVLSIVDLDRIGGTIGNFSTKLSPEAFQNLITIIGRHPNIDFNGIDGFFRLFDKLGVETGCDKRVKILGDFLEKGVDLKLILNSNMTGNIDNTGIKLFKQSQLDDLQKVLTDETKSKEEIEKVLNNLMESIQTGSVNPGSLISDSKSPLLEKFIEVLNIPEKFNPKTGLEYISGLPPGEKQKAIKVWREKLKEQLDIIATFPTEIKQSAEKFDYVNGKSEDILNALIKEFTPKLEGLSVGQRKQILIGIEKYVNRKHAVYKYANDPKYKGNSKQLLADALNTDVIKLKGDVTMDMDGANFTFYVHNIDDFKLVNSYGDEEEAKSVSSSIGGFASVSSNIPELAGTISVVNGSKLNFVNKGVKIHETKHMDNQVVMPDHSNGDVLSRAKDEILAYLTDGSSIERIRDILLNSAIYNYYGSFKIGPEEYKKIKELYEHELAIAISIAKKLQQANIPNYIDILAVTPVRQWGNLEKIYLNPKLTEVQKFEKNIKSIFEKAYETYFALKRDSSNLIGEHATNAIFGISWGVPVGIILANYLNEEYPNWRDDLENNTTEFYKRMQNLMKEDKITGYLNEYFK